MDFLDLLIDMVALHHKKKIAKGTSECLREHTWSIIRNATTEFLLAQNLIFWEH